MKNTYIIGEIGINHNGSLEKAKRLIDIAAAAGCDAVKFQKRNPDVCVPEAQKSKPRSTPWGEITYLEYKWKLEFGQEEYDEIDRYCKQQGIAWSASPWDMESLKFLDQYDIPFIKIASATITDDDILEAAIATGKRVIISTGMSTEEEIDHAIKVLQAAAKKYNNTNEIGVLHCNSTYPAPVDELNLSAIRTLADKYPYVEVGYSGHEFRLGTSVAAVYLGASIVERHITLDRTDYGSDQMSSVEPQGLFKLVSGIRELEAAFGDGVISVTDSELEPRKRLRG